MAYCYTIRADQKISLLNFNRWRVQAEPHRGALPGAEQEICRSEEDPGSNPGRNHRQKNFFGDNQVCILELVCVLELGYILELTCVLELVYILELVCVLELAYILELVCVVEQACVLELECIQYVAICNN